jgi:deoxyribonuclease IV
MNYTKVGFHVSIAGGISNSVDNALKIGCNAFQIFSRNPRGWAVKPLEEEEAKKFQTKLANSKIQRGSVCVHIPYLPNLSSPNSELYNKSIDSLADEIKRCSMLSISYLVIHLGSHLGKGSDNGISQVVKACNFAFEHHKSSSNQNGNSVTILFENSAGQKNNIGSKFEEIRVILDKLNSPREFGVCLDTCHAFAAGYDLRTEDNVNTTMDQFNNIIGLKELKLMHLNDSKDKINSNRDRHEHIGFGNIGKEGFRALVKHKAIMRLPLIMETPNDDKCGNDLKVILDLIGQQYVR